MEWSVVVPAKRLAVAKTRLSRVTAPVPDLHANLVLALLADTVTAALAAAGVADVVVVTDDPRAAAVVSGLGARTVPDEPDRGLNPALEHGARATRTPAVAALSSDLPALRPTELAGALQAAGAAGAPQRCLVTDAAGTGTTLLTARAGDLAPRFGAGSAAAHAADGALSLTGDWPGLRRDVDTPADLAEAVRLGVGRHTSRLLTRLPVPAPPR